jgi:uncharacterized protein YndB with AHSA1/START domain
MTGDTIERELLLPAPPERVWDALTDPTQVSQWLGTEAEIELRPGGAAAFGWPEEGRFLARVEDVDRPRRFSFRWAHECDTPVDQGPNTLVAFTLEPFGAGTRLRLKESGFASLPEKIQAQALRDNSAGWQEELADLARYLESASVGG